MPTMAPTMSRISAGVAVPVFAFFSADVAVGGLSGLGQALRDPVAVGIVLGLVLGKAIGILSATYLVSKFSHADRDESLGWLDVLGLALLAGIGFTVSLLIGELAFGVGSERDEHVKVAVLSGSLLSAVLATAVLQARGRRYRRLHELETTDSNADESPTSTKPPSAPDPNPGGRRRRDFGCRGSAGDTAAWVWPTVPRTAVAGFGRRQAAHRASCRSGVGPLEGVRSWPAL